MADYTSPGEALSRGLSGGIQLGTTIGDSITKRRQFDTENARKNIEMAMSMQEAAAKRKQAEWENQLKLGSEAVKIAGDKDMPMSWRVNAMNKGARPLLQRLGVDLPEFDPKSLDVYGPAVEGARKILERVDKGDIPAEKGLAAAQQLFVDANNGQLQETESGKIQRELTLDPFKQKMEADQKKAKPADQMTPEEAQKELFQINTSMINSMRMTPEEAMLSNRDPKAAEMFRRSKQAEFDQLAESAVERANQLRTKLPDPGLPYISPVTVAKMRQVNPNLTDQMIAKRFRLLGRPQNAAQ